MLIASRCEPENTSHYAFTHTHTEQVEIHLEAVYSFYIHFDRIDCVRFCYFECIIHFSSISMGIRNIMSVGLFSFIVVSSLP